MLSADALPTKSAAWHVSQDTLVCGAWRHGGGAEAPREVIGSGAMQVEVSHACGCSEPWKAAGAAAGRLALGGGRTLESRSALAALKRASEEGVGGASMAEEAERHKLLEASIKPAAAQGGERPPTDLPQANGGALLPSLR